MGPANDRGLRLRSFPGDDGVTASFLPWPEHDNGLGHLNGGIISALLDCHSAAAVMHETDVRGYTPLPGAALPYVTAGLDVRFLRPALLAEPVSLLAVVTEAGESQMTENVELRWDSKPRAAATALWKRWRASAVSIPLAGTSSRAASASGPVCAAERSRRGVHLRTAEGPVVRRRYRGESGAPARAAVPERRMRAR